MAILASHLVLYGYEVVMWRSGGQERYQILRGNNLEEFCKYLQDGEDEVRVPPAVEAEDDGAHRDGLHSAANTTGYLHSNKDKYHSILLVKLYSTSLLTKSNRQTLIVTLTHSVLPGIAENIVTCVQLG